MIKVLTPRDIIETSGGIIEASGDIFEASEAIFEVSRDMFEVSRDMFEQRILNAFGILNTIKSLDDIESSIKNTKLENSNILNILPIEVISLIVNSYTQSSKQSLACVSKTSIHDFDLRPTEGFDKLEEVCRTDDNYSLIHGYNKMITKDHIAFLGAKYGNVKLVTKYFPSSIVCQSEILLLLGELDVTPQNIDNIFDMCDDKTYEYYDMGIVCAGKMPDRLSSSIIITMFEKWNLEYASFITTDYKHSIHKKIGAIANIISEQSARIILNTIEPNLRYEYRVQIMTAIAKRRSIDFAMVYANCLHLVCELEWRRHIRDDYLDIILIMLCHSQSLLNHNIMMKLIYYCIELEKYQLVDTIHMYINCDEMKKEIIVI